MPKLGKHKTCIKRLKRFGISEELAKLVCGKYLVGDDEWAAEPVTKPEKKKKKEETGFEIKIPKEKKEKKEKKPTLTPAGGKAVKKEPGKARPITSEPRAFQLPLFQPWRSPKSEHRLQTKLEKVLTAEQKFLTLEQLMKRTEYAIGIKKRDSDYLLLINQLVKLSENIEDENLKIIINNFKKLNKTPINWEK